MAILYHSAAPEMQAWHPDFARALPEQEFRLLETLAPAADITAAILWMPPHGLLASLPNLRVIFSLGAGVDHLFADPSFPAHIPVVRVVDPDMTRQMADYVLLHTLLHHRRMPEYAAQQTTGGWNHLAQSTPAQTRVGIMGLGEMGSATARRLRDNGFAVSGWSRSPKREEGVRCFAGAAEWDAFLAATEILVCLLPLTPQTRGILRAETFRKLARPPADTMPGPILINPGRGAHINEPDLLAALEDGTLGGASLDVFAEEPLPSDHPLRHKPNVVITPHNAAITNPSFLIESVRANLARLAHGDSPTPLADPSRGY